MSRLHDFLHLIRSLFPRWNFFDRANFDIVLEVKTRSQSEWTRVSFISPRAMFGLFVNPKVNLALAQQSLLDQFVQDLRERQHEIETQTSFHMIAACARHSLVAPEAFQFKVTARHERKVLALYSSAWIDEVVA